MENKAQTTIFIILAIIIVAAVAGYFIFRASTVSEEIPASMEPIYTSFLYCL